MNGMYTTVPMEAEFFLASIMAGGIAAVLYDLLRISRKLTKPTSMTINIQDALFMVAAAVLLYMAAYFKNSGEVGWHGFLGFGCGAGCYAVLVKNRFLKAGTFVVELLIRTLKSVTKIILYPFVFILKIFYKPIKVVAWYTGRGVSRVKGASRGGLGKMRIAIKNLGIMIRKR